MGTETKQTTASMFLQFVKCNLFNLTMQLNHVLPQSLSYNETDLPTTTNALNLAYSDFLNMILYANYQ